MSEQVDNTNPWAAEDGPEIVFDASRVREVTATNLVDEHQSERGIKRDLAKGAEDLGEGFLMQEEPVLIERGPDGGIVRITPLSEIPGIRYEGGVLAMGPEKTNQQIETEAMVAPTKESPVPLGAADRDKLRHILTTRLFEHYKTESSLRNRAKWNPFRDGLPEVPAGAPSFMQPSKELPLVPATPQQVYDYLLKHVAKRAEIVDTKRYGGGTLQDMSLRIS